MDTFRVVAWLSGKGFCRGDNRWKEQEMAVSFPSSLFALRFVVVVLFFVLSRCVVCLPRVVCARDLMLAALRLSHETEKEAPGGRQWRREEGIMGS